MTPRRPRLQLLAGLLAATSLLALAPPAGAVLKEIERGYEVTLAAVRIPTVSDGNLTVFPCPRCGPVTLRVTTATAWYPAWPARAPATQVEFLQALRNAGANRNALVYVYYEPRTRRVTRLVLDAPGGARP